MTSLANRVADLSPEERQEFWDGLTPDQQAALLYDWDFWARTEQMYPAGEWLVWLLLAGRGYGKTRVGSETVRMWHHSHSRIALVAETAADVRDVIVEGESGILAVSPPGERPLYEPSKRRLTWPNGCVATLYSGKEPDQLRGPQHEVALVDELAKYQYPQETWDNLMMGLRLGTSPRAVVTTTPRPLPIIKELAGSKTTHLTRGTTFENLDNLAPTFREMILTRYEGTTLGRQELYAEIIEDTDGALWKRADIEAHRTNAPPVMQRIVVGVDPPGSATGAECGIVAAGMDEQDPPHFYILDDRSLHGSPDTWGAEAVAAYRSRNADRLIGERNFGGDMVEATIRTIDPDVSYRDVTSSRGKLLRAEPIAALAEQGRLHHVGTFGALEDELCSFDGSGPSPNRMDACLVEGSLVLTATGEVPIEDVRPGMTVWTRDGWREVVAHRMTQANAPLWAARLSNGRTLLGTPDHLLWVEGKGWTRLDASVFADRLSGWKLSRIEASSTSAIQPPNRRPTAFTSLPRGAQGFLCSIVRYARTLTARSQMGGTFTTWMTTRSTTTRPTLLRFPRRTTLLNTLRTRSGRRDGWRIWRPSGWLPLRGIAPQTGCAGTASTVSVRGTTASLWRSSASSAEDLPKHGSTGSDIAHAGAGIALLDARADTRLRPSVRSVGARFDVPSTAWPAPVLLSVVGSYDAGRTGDVYDLQIAGTPEFVAEGAIVHNCVFAVTELMERGSRAASTTVPKRRIYDGY